MAFQNHISAHIASPTLAWIGDSVLERKCKSEWGRSGCVSKYGKNALR